MKRVKTIQFGKDELIFLETEIINDQIEIDLIGINFTETIPNMGIKISVHYRDPNDDPLDLGQHLSVKKRTLKNIRDWIDWKLEQ